MSVCTVAQWFFLLISSKHRPAHEGVPFPRLDSGAELNRSSRSEQLPTNYPDLRIRSDTVNNASSSPSLPWAPGASDDLKSEHAKVFVVGAWLKKDAGSGVESAARPWDDDDA